ncbi:MAG: hypothetical protein HC830_14230 [Bacteroidetes bacterium]|nr:hypothetical protein [Bacteroidota bacterium]
MKNFSTVIKKSETVLSTRITYTFMLAFIFMVSVSLQSFSQGAPDKKAAEIKKLETTLKTTKANLAKAEKQLAMADSLLTTGETMVSEGKAEIKSLGCRT